ncbi:MAG: primosomal protein N' [Chloroflexi bacterium]|nr:primosomal protein N' [Chloroflexota bacterium]
MNAKAPAYAEVIVAAGDVRGDQTFHYSVPDDLQGKLRPGQLVMAPFGARQLPGVVTALADTSPVAETRDLLQLVWEPPLIGPRQLALARWVAARYGAPLRSALDLVGPPRLAHHLHAVYTVASADEPGPKLPGTERRVLTLLRERGGLSEAALRSELGKTAATRGVARLVRRGLVTRHVSLRFPEPPAERLVEALPPPDGQSPAALLRRAPRQRALWEHLRRLDGPMPVAQVLRLVSASRSSLQGLVARGLARIQVRWSASYVVTGSRDAALGAEVSDPPAGPQLVEALTRRPPGAAVMQGCESDRWSMYAGAIDRVTAEGRQALVIAPEASTAAALADWLAARLGVSVADATRARTPAQRVALWRALRAGEIDLLVGTRDATFAPLTRLGLVIVDREEDAGHKHRVAPRYHVPVCAARLAQLVACPLLLGTETPRVATFHAVETGQARLVQAGAPGRLARLQDEPERLSGARRSSLDAEIVDTRRAAVVGRYGSVSRVLLEALRETLALDERAVLYVNRRGMAALTICRTCAHVFECPRCSTGLVQHRQTRQMVCHICNWRDSAPRWCPVCEGDRLRLWGYGSEAVAEAVTHLLPRAVVARIDSDRPLNAMDADVSAFERGAVQVLVGTQRLLGYGKRLQAGLLGIVQADIGLQFPDFLAPERVFLTLSRLRHLTAANGATARTVVQTMMPHHHVIQALQTGSYLRFFQAEMEQRRGEGLPPLRPLIKASFGHANETRAEEEARRARRELTTVLAAGQPLDLDVLGPAPAFVYRQRGQYQWQLLLQGADAEKALPLFHGGWTLDADPLDLT